MRTRDRGRSLTRCSRELKPNLPIELAATVFRPSASLGDRARLLQSLFASKGDACFEDPADRRRVVVSSDTGMCLSVNRRPATNHNSGKVLEGCGTAVVLAIALRRSAIPVTSNAPHHRVQPWASWRCLGLSQRDKAAGRNLGASRLHHSLRGAAATAVSNQHLAPFPFCPLAKGEGAASLGFTCFGFFFSLLLLWPFFDMRDPCPMVSFV